VIGTQLLRTDSSVSVLLESERAGAASFAILATLLFRGQQADRILDHGRQFLEQRWPIVLFALLLVGGGVASTFGMLCIASS
jgi:hypothetical protein